MVVVAATAPEAEVVGRRTELEAIGSFLVGEEARALVLEGAAGIGKTALWLEGVERARRDEQHVLAARPAGAETPLALGGFRDLLADVPREARDGLPEIQQHALARALLEDEVGDGAVDAGVLAAGFLHLLQELARERPVLLAIDDLQWLDASSAALVVYALRRVSGLPIRLLTTCRGEPGAPLPSDLQHALGPTSLVRLPVGPLSEGAIRRMLRLTLGLSLSRMESHAVSEASQGNPLYALELGRSGIELDRDGLLQLPANLERLVGLRLEALPPSAHDALLVTAALAEPRLETLTRAGVRGGLDACLRADVLAVERERVRFAHPLVATAVWAAADEHKRRRVHRLLAEALDDREQRAWHLALATDPPDAGVAALLEEAAADARRRGAPAAAAELFDRALVFTPSNDPDAWGTTAVQAAAAHVAAGHWQRSLELSEEAQQRLPAGPGRAAILITRTEMQPGLQSLFRQAIAEAGRTPVGVQARIGLAVQHGLAGQWDGAVEAAHDAALVARGTGDDALIGVALTFEGAMKIMGSRRDGVHELEEALDMERRLGTLPTSAFESPKMWLGLALCFGDDPDRARPLLDEQLRVAAERGEDLSTYQILQLRVQLEQRAGNISEARTAAELALERVEAVDYDYHRSTLHGVLAGLEAGVGNLERARALGGEAVDRLESVGDRLWSTYARAALLLAEVCSGNAAAALAHADALDAVSTRECWWSYHQADELEALVLAGEHVRALARSEALRRAGEELDLPRFLAWAARGEALVLAARSELEAARERLEDALAQHERFVLPFDRARTCLALGHVLRRLAHRHDARAALGEALAQFEQLGARHFEAAAREELKHVGGRPPAGEHELTGTEERIARLVASGLSNKEVAAELYLSVSTIEAALTRVYRKLGLSSRSQLAQALGEREGG